MCCRGLVVLGANVLNVGESMDLGSTIYWALIILNEELFFSDKITFNISALHMIRGPHSL